MAKIGVLKPFSGTGSSLKNIVLEDGEIAFETPNEGPGTGIGSIKMGDGSTSYKNLPYFMGEAHTVIVDIPTVTVGTYYWTGSSQGPTITGLDTANCNVSGATAIDAGNYTLTISLKDSTTSEWSDGTSADKTWNWSISWTYDTGTTEAALLNNLYDLSKERIGKIYYIQAYYHNSSGQYVEGTPSIETGMPYMVIGKNHDGTSGTVDLMSMCAADYRKFNDRYNSWSYGKYSISKFYSWLSNTCVNGYSAQIQAKMQNMTERWKEATGNETGTMQSRTTKVKILNPRELFGSSITSWNSTYTGDISASYGTMYEAFTDSIDNLDIRRVFHDKSMSTATHYWTNSYYRYDSYPWALLGNYMGHCAGTSARSANALAPVIRLALNS